MMHLMCCLNMFTHKMMIIEFPHTVSHWLLMLDCLNLFHWHAI